MQTPYNMQTPIKKRRIDRDIDLDLEENINNMVISNSDIFLKPLMTNANNIINDNSINREETVMSINNSINNTIENINNYVNNSEWDNKIISDGYNRYFLAKNIVSKTELDNNKIKCILIASFLSVFFDYSWNDKNYNLNKFIDGSNDDINLINKMIYCIYNDVDTIESWILIPKYITIIFKINRIGIIEYCEYINKENIYNELKYYCNIILNLKFNNVELNSEFKRCSSVINNIYNDLHYPYSITDLKNILFY